jgi:hypothetical protein
MAMADPDFEMVIKTVVGVIVAIIAIAFAYVQSRTRKNQLRGLASALGGRLAGNWLDDYVIVDSQGMEARISLQSKSRNRPSQLRIKLMVPPKFRWAVRRSGSLNLAIRWDGLRKLDNPAPQLGADLRITVSDQMQAMMFFAEPKNQAAIREFFARGFTEISAGKNETAALKNSYDAADLDPALVRGQIEALRRLAIT